MPRTRVTDDEFIAAIAPLLNRPGVTYREVAAATGLSIAGVRHKIARLRDKGRIAIRRPQATFLAEVVGADITTP